MLVTERDFDIGERLYALRRERALTQDELAEEAQIHKVTISDIERGERKASARTLKKLARALGVEVKALTS